MSTETTPPAQKPVHIVSLRVERYKRIKVATVRPNPQDRLVNIGGRNDQGKTSLLDSIVDAMRGRDSSPAVPVQKGHKKARVVLDLGDVIVKVRFTAAGGRELIVEDTEGNPLPSPQAVMDRLTGKVSFDAEDFIRKEAGDQRKILQRIVGLDFSPVEKRKKEVFDSRAIANAEVKRLEAVVASSPKHEGIPEEESSATDLADQLALVNKHNAAGDQLSEAVLSAQKSLREASAASADAKSTETDGKDAIDEIEEQIVALQKRLDTAREVLLARTANRALRETHVTNMQGALKGAEDALAAFVRQDPLPIRHKMTELDGTNAKVRANKTRTKAVTDFKSARDKAESLNLKVEECDAEKQKMLEEAKFPVTGLSFSENGILYDGLPFEQASASVRRKVSVAIGAALNPKFRVMIVRDASLLDEAAMEELRALAHEHDLQVWCEMVTGDPKGEKGPDARCTVVIEDGEVFGAPPEQEASAQADPEDSTRPLPSKDGSGQATQRSQDDLGFGG